jgi:predicted MPP superfamily phosphohydrolase
MGRKDKGIPMLRRSRKLTRRDFVCGAVASGVAVGLYTWQVEPHWVQYVYHPLPVHNLPQRLIGCTLVQLSDLHIGLQVDDDYLKGVFDVVRRLRPEIVVVTGDFTSYDRNILKHVEEVLSHLPNGSLGTFGVLGNHDYGPGVRDYQHADRLAALAESNGMRILRNGRESVEGLLIVGLDDLWADRFNAAVALAGLAKDAAAIVLSHNPDTADLAGWGDYRGWILAGHTHGGQCKPPFLDPPLLPVKNRRYVAGEYALVGGRQMYINRGIGHLTPVRFNVRPEVTIFHLARE